MNDASRPVLVRDFRRIGVLACVLLVTLRLFIGWQFLYEGLWKLDTQDSASPWTSGGFLKNAQGPFREMFRGMTGDPNDELWLDPQYMQTKWTDWAARFADHYKLDDETRQRLSDMIVGPEVFAAVLEKLPAGAKIPDSLQDSVRFDAKRKRLYVDGKQHLLPAEKFKLISQAKMPASREADPAAWDTGKAFMDAVEKAYDRNTRLSYLERLQVALGTADPERGRLVFSNFKGTLGTEAPEDIGFYYRKLLADYEAERQASAGLEFEQRHLARTWSEIQELRAELVNPVRALENQLHEQARGLLNQQQLAQGPLPEPWTDQRIADALAIWALIILGLLLIAGLGTRAAAVAGAGMVLSFYLVWPPFPGVPADPGPEHAYIVNKNLIEVAALLALAALPSGQWFGVDGLIYRGWQWARTRRRSSKEVVPRGKPANTQRPVRVSK